MFLEIKRYFRKVKHYLEHLKDNGGVPAPYRVKHKLLLNFFPDSSTIIETGTYLGETTRVLSRHFPSIYTIEPHPPFFHYNERCFRSNQRIQVVNGVSEDVLPSLLTTISGEVGFWLDGHFSGAGTHGEISESSPILKELEAIASWFNLDTGNNKAFVAIDDARLFVGADGYPTLERVLDIGASMGMEAEVLRDIIFMRPASSE